MAEEASSLVAIIETTVVIISSPEKLHDLFVGKKHHIPSASPSFVHGCELHEGEMGQVGSVVTWNYFHGKSTL